MAQKTKVNSTKLVKKETKIEKIQKIYGKDESSVTLSMTTKHLEDMGFKSLGQLLQVSR